MSGPYADIIERLEGATGQDRELDEEIQAMSVGATAEWREYKQSNAYYRGGMWVSIGAIEPYTGSIDAAVALVERLLPGHPWTVWSRAYGAVAHQPEGRTWSTTNDPLIAEAWKRTPPIHLLIALFRALQARDETK